MNCSTYSNLIANINLQIIKQASIHKKPSRIHFKTTRIPLGSYGDSLNNTEIKDAIIVFMYIVYIVENMSNALQ